MLDRKYKLKLYTLYSVSGRQYMSHPITGTVAFTSSTDIEICETALR